MAFDNIYQGKPAPDVSTSAPDWPKFLDKVKAHHEKVKRAIADPLGYGYPGRVPILRPIAECQIEIDARLNYWIRHASQTGPAPLGLRVLYLLDHGYYTAAELLKHPSFDIEMKDVNMVAKQPICKIELMRISKLIDKLGELRLEMKKRRIHRNEASIGLWKELLRLDNGATLGKMTTMVERHLLETEAQLKEGEDTSVQKKRTLLVVKKQAVLPTSRPKPSPWKSRLLGTQ